MKTYYCVKSEFYDNGTVKAAMLSGERKAKPTNSSRSLLRMDAYIDWFENKTEAEKFLAETKNA